MEFKQLETTAMATGTPKYNESTGVNRTNNRAARTTYVLIHFVDVLYKITWSLSKDKGNGEDNARKR